MKKTTLILVLVLTIQQGFSYTWESYGPEGIKANNLCLLYSYNAQSVICTDSGMYLNTSQGVPNWEYFDIQAKDAVDLNDETILIIINEGGYSDGIYSFNLLTYELNLIEYCINPNFIKCYEPEWVFFVGHEGGLLRSENGTTWTEVDFFEGKNCVGLVDNYDNLIVNVSADVSHLYLSPDIGINWTEAGNSPGWVSSMAFYYGYGAYCIFPDNSYSSGLWHSVDNGDNWENSFYSTNMNAICDIMPSNKLLLGWKNANKDDEGIAIYDPDAPQSGLTFLNEGLPSTQINKIKYMELLCSGGIIFTCTDEGVYQCWDYFVGMDEYLAQTNSINVFPNPITNQTTIKLNLQETNGIKNSISVYNNQGKIVDEIKTGTNPEIIWDRGNLPSGIYYMVVKIEKERLTKKFIIL